MLARRRRPGFMSTLLRIARAGKPDRGPWRRQSRSPCRLPHANRPKPRRPPRAACARVNRRQPASPSRCPSTRNRLLEDRLLREPRVGTSDGNRRRRIPLSVRFAHGVVAAFAVCLLLQAMMQIPDLWRFQLLNQIVCGSLLLSTCIAGMFGAHRSPLICKACAVIGWWIGLWSLILDRAFNPVPIIGMAIFLTAGLAADALADSQQSRHHGTDDLPRERGVRELVFRRWGPGV